MSAVLLCIESMSTLHLVRDRVLRQDVREIVTRCPALQARAECKGVQ